MTKWAQNNCVIINNMSAKFRITNTHERKVIVVVFDECVECVVIAKTKVFKQSIHCVKVFIRGFLFSTYYSLLHLERSCLFGCTVHRFNY
jgi:predicted cation transporter